jgi:DNA-binding SARP family transcriptional activator
LALPCEEIGKSLATPRIYLTGRVSIENGENLVDERDFPGRQGRLAFVFLSTGRRHPIAREELVSAVWPDEQPRAVDTALSALLSKLRGAFRKAGLSPADASIDVRLGAITMSMPDQTWVDIEAGANAVDAAEGALRKEDLARAWSLANVVVSVARRPFLLDEEAPWIEAQRTRLRTMLLRGLQCLTVLSAANAEPSLAVQYANEMIDIDPFLETAYQQLMRIHSQTGNRAEALRAFGRCRELLRDELGANPSPQTQALFMEILRQE